MHAIQILLVAAGALSISRAFREARPGRTRPEVILDRVFWIGLGAWIIATTLLPLPLAWREYPLAAFIVMVLALRVWVWRRRTAV